MALICTLCLLFTAHLLEGTPISWQGTAPGGFSAHIQLSAQTLAIDELLTVDLHFTYPEDYQLDTSEMRYNLLRSHVFGPAPYLLMDETSSAKHMTYHLDPQVTGPAALTFYAFNFPPKDTLQPTVSIFSPIFHLEFIPAKPIEPFALVPAPLMPLDNIQPIDLTLEMRQQIFALSSQEAMRNSALLNDDSLPWNCFFGIFLAVFIGLLLPRLPHDKSLDSSN